jgi:multidrug efflux pump subunit AcrA (membrane-fusion protein)
VPVFSPTGELLAPRDSYALPRRDYKKIVGAAFLAVLLALIFFSRTIYGYNLPVITATKPENGRLSKLETSTGIVDWSAVENLYAVVGGVVDEVLVKEGEAVAEGQELYRLRFDRDEAERKLREIQNSRQKLHTEIQNLNLSLAKQNRYMGDLSSETYEEDAVSSYELDAVTIDIRKAQADLRDMREREEEGEASEWDVDKARYALQALYLKQEELERKLAEQQEDAKKTLEEQEQNRASRLQDYEADIAALQLQLQAKNIELSSLAIQEEPYRKALADFETHAVVAATTDGTVISLSAVRGETVRAEQLLASIGADGTYEVECNISLDNNFVLPGDTVELSNSTHVVEGTVTKITPTVQNKTVTIEVIDPAVIAGETFDITFEKISDTTYTLVPNGALNQDNDGYFLNQVGRRDGIMGQEYYLERLDVYIGDSDAKNTAIVRGITFFEPIMLISDKPATAGDVVALSNAGDFFEQ